ncbi:MAG: TlpA disulfide reductase family protein [Ginsengibacter sp.]
MTEVTSIPGKESNSVTGDSLITIISTIDSTLKYYYLHTDGLSGEPVFISAFGTLTIQSSKPVYLMEPTSLQTGYYLNPSDTIIITKDNSGNLLLESKKDIKNNELQFFRKLTDTLGSVRNLYKSTYLTRSVTMKERDSLINDKFLSRVNFLQNYSQNHAISDTFKNYTLKAFEYSRIYEKLNLNYPGFSGRDIKYFYKDSIFNYVKIFNNNEINNNPFYLDALIVTARFFAKEKNDHYPHISFSMFPQNSLRDLYIKSKTLFTNDAKEFVLSEILFYAMADKSISKEEITRSIPDIKNDVYRNILEKKLQYTYRTFSGSILNQQILLNPDSSSLLWKQLLENHKGRIVFIDIWATWCLPCIEEIPYSKELQKKYSGKVDFVFLSFDEDFRKWKNYSILGKESAKNSFWIEGNFSSVIAEKFGIISIPRYIIIDKSGNIVAQDAPRPSDSRLITLLNKYVGN